MHTPNDKDATSNIDWPEEALNNEREVFYAELQQRLGPAEWVVVVPTPAPLGAVRRSIEEDCNNVLKPMEMAYDGVAWLCHRANLTEALPGLFHARRPELAFLAFDKRPEVGEVVSALQSADAGPAKRILLFDDGELVEIRDSVFNQKR
jgi:hypothetical protein